MDRQIAHVLLGLLNDLTPLYVLAVGLAVGARLVSMVARLMNDDEYEAPRQPPLFGPPTDGTVSQRALDTVNRGRPGKPAATGKTVSLGTVRIGVFCSSCGAENEADAEFCVYCGVRLDR